MKSIIRIRNIREDFRRRRIRLGRAFCAYNNECFYIGNWKLEIGNSDRGSLLLLALLVMSVIMVGSVALGSLVLSGIRQAAAIDNAIVAYYAAESGVEESLYRLRKSDAEPRDLENTSKNFQNGAFFEIGSYGSTEAIGVDISDTEESIVFLTLEKDDFTQLDLFGAGGLPTDIRALRIKAGGDGTEWLEASWFGWTNGELTPFQTKLFSHNALTAEGGALVDLTQSIGVQSAYRVKLHALYGDFENVDIRAYSSEGGSDEFATVIPSRIVVRVHGIYRGATQSLTYAMPRTSPLGGLFDFVLFSECSILKGIEEECQ